MKRLSPLPALLLLLCPLFLALGFLFFPSGFGGRRANAAPTAAPTTGNIAVALTDSASANFQSLLLNLVSVRLNPSSNISIGGEAAGWVTVPVGPFASPSPVAELQVDLNNVQQNAQILNTTGIKPGTYRQVELNLDPNRPASAVPNCPSGPGGVEGCISYPLAFSSPAPPFRVAATVPVGKTTLTSLVIDFIPGPISAPSPSSQPGGSYTMTGASIAVVNSAGFLGTVGGNVAGAVSGEVVSALLSGTDTFVTSVTASSGSYFLALPAAPDGTAYDLVASGAGSAYGVATVALIRGASVIQNFAVGPETSSSLTGTVVDQCNGKAIEGATVNIYASPNNATDCSTDISRCIVAASASTDELGNYPMPGSKVHPESFSQVPAGTYGIQVSMAGYDPLLTKLSVGTSGPQCGTTGGACNFSLSRGTITGTVNLVNPVPSGTTTTFQVFAEDHGTNKIEAALPVPVQIKTGENSASFALNVPTGVGSLDLFASTVDLFEGAAAPNPGHSIAVLSAVSPPAACTAGGADFAAVDCVGHASVSGEVGVSPDSGTTVRMAKNGVQLMESAVGFDGTANARAFSFCAPADIYTIGRYESGVPQGNPTTVALPAPASTSTPCPSICGSSSSCPGICSNTSLGSLL